MQRTLMVVTVLDKTATESCVEHVALTTPAKMLTLPTTLMLATAAGTVPTLTGKPTAGGKKHINPSKLFNERGLYTPFLSTSRTFAVCYSYEFATTSRADEAWKT